MWSIQGMALRQIGDKGELVAADWLTVMKL